MEKLLNITMDFLYKNEDGMDEEKAEIIKYGLELLFLKITFFVATMIIGALMHSFWECLIFTALFSGIRSLAGGYHASTRVQCFVQSMLIFAAVLGVLKLVKTYAVILVPLAVLALISAAVIFRFAPVDTENKRLDEDEISIFRKKSRIAMLIEIAVAVIAYFIGFQSISCSVMLALIVTAILISAELIINKIRVEYE